MSFEAGSITGHLGLETSEYTHGLLEAEGINELFPASVTEFLANPLLGFMETAKEVFESVKDFVEDAVSEVAKSGFEIAIAAERMGASAEFMKKWEVVGESVGIPLETLANSFRGLQKSASDAVEQGGPALKYWNELGISTEDLKSHMGDLSGLFDMVREHISALPTQAERTAAAMHLMRGAGSELNPIFSMTSEKIDELTKGAAGMGDTFTEQDAAIAKNVHELGDQFDHAWAGIEQATAKPILQFLSDHMNEIIPMVKEGANVIETDIGKVMDVLNSHSPQIMTFLNVATHLLEGVSDLIADILQGITWVLDKASEFNKFVASIPGVGIVEKAFGAAYDSLGASGEPATVNVNVNNKDSDEATAAKIAEQTKKAFLANQKKQKQKIDAILMKHKVASTIGGNY